MQFSYSLHAVYGKTTGNSELKLCYFIIVIKTIEVKSYSGRRANEYPVQIRYCNCWKRVSVVKEYIEEDLMSRCRKRVFIVEDEDANRYSIYYDQGLQLWFIMD